MRDTDLAPDPQLMESMRAVGYTLETAVADVIDNSLTAGADRVDVLFTSSPDVRIAILDNGAGMDSDTLVQAMRLAGRAPSSCRQPHDLGRFGLGLKTAGLSQARSITVATKQSGQLHAVRWDLDYLAATGRWALQILNDSEVQHLPWLGRLSDNDAGTLVLWEKLDQLHAAPELVESHLDEKMQSVRQHLSLVFHRFTGGAAPPLKRPLALHINGAQVPLIDPFLTNNRATQVGQQERIRVDEVWVDVQPYTLPYLNKLSAADRRAAQIAGTLRDSQGFYVYRAGRLVLWGTWFRIMPRDELGKLARVRVDIPNSLDHLWSLDIKKSSATPPPEVRRRLVQIAGQMIGPSRRTHRYRGRPASVDSIERMWTLIEDRGAFRYELNRSHPMIETVFDGLDPIHQTALSQLLRAIEGSFPVEDAYNRMGSDQTHTPSTVVGEEVVEMARALRALIGGDLRELAQKLALVEPFNSINDLETFLKEVIGE
jgi:hypothetical protein